MGHSIRSKGSACGHNETIKTKHAKWCIPRRYISDKMLQTVYLLKMSIPVFSLRMLEARLPLK